MATQPEAKLSKKIRAHAEERGAWVFNVHGGDNPFQEVGVMDLIMCYRGRFVGVEVKLPGEKASRAQEVVIRRVREAGGIAEVVHSVADIERILNRTTRK